MTKRDRQNMSGKTLKSRKVQKINGELFLRLVKGSINKVRSFFVI